MPKAFEIIDHHFSRPPSPVTPTRKIRPNLLSTPSSGSVLSTTTTALDTSQTRDQNVIDTREGYYGTAGDGSSVGSLLPMLHTAETDITQSMSQLLTEDSPAQRDITKNKQEETSAQDFARHDTDSISEAEDITRLEAMSEEDQVNNFLSRDKHFLILSAAGKPIYARHGTGQVVSGYMGILQAIMGFYQDATTPDTLQSFSSEELQVVMLVKGPVYLVTISRLGELESTLKLQLEFLYDTLVSSVTITAMKRQFDRGDNFDLGRLLAGTEPFMNKICDALTSGNLYFDTVFASLAVFRLKATLRAKMNNIIAANRPASTNLLYGMVAIDKKLVSVLRPKGHSMFPTDLRLVFETVWERGFEEGQDYWLPLCLPKFNSTGFLHVFVSFLAPSIAIILISADKDDFFELQSMKNNIQTKFITEELVRDLVRAKFSQVSTKMLGINQVVEHFVFKNRSRVQYLCPELPTNAKQGRQPAISRMQIMRIYEQLQGLGARRYKLQIHHFPHESGSTATEILALSWVTQAFELFVISSPSRKIDPSKVTQSSHVAELIGASNIIHQFIRREEGRIWLNDGLTF